MNSRTPRSNASRGRVRPRAIGQSMMVLGALLVIAMIASTLFASSLLLPTPTAAAASGVVNTYVSATVTGGVPDTSGLSADDCALVIQMDGSAAGNAGNYEILDPANSTPQLSYDNGQPVQFVVLPGGCDSAQTIDAGGVTAQPWNGSTGGVVFLGGTTLTMAADIDVSGAGFTQADSPSWVVGCESNGVTGGSDANPQEAYGGGGGGGGVIGGGGGGGDANWQFWNSFNSVSGEGGTLAAGGAGGQTAAGSPGAGGGGDACVSGNGASAPFSGNGVDNNDVGAGGAGGGSYGGGGGSCGAFASAAYAAGGGGGASWTGGGAAGVGGTNTGGGHADDDGPNPDGTPGADNLGVAITDADHYLNDGQPKLFLGGAGGDDRVGANSGAGGGIVVLAFNSIDGNGNAIVANGEAGGTSDLGPISGAGGGAGGQILIQANNVSDTTVAANGASGGSNDPGANHTGSAGAGGGGGAIWFDGAGADATNTGSNDGATSADSSLSAIGLSNVDWSVVGGSAGTTVDFTVVVGGTTYTGTQWNGIYSQAGALSITNGIPLLDALVSVSGQSAAAIIAAFPDITAPDNPKNAGFGCTPGAGGNGLVSITPSIPPTLEIEKSTSGVGGAYTPLDSDVAPGQTFVVGQPVVWTYVVTVSDGAPADNVTITDDLVAASGITCDVDGDGTFESTNVAGTIQGPATFACQATGVAELGQYANVATVTGTSGGDPLEPDTDPSHYFGAEPSIHLEKQTNTVEADTDTVNDGSETATSVSDGASNPIPVDAPVTWTFQITNDGVMPVRGVTLTDATTVANTTPGATSIVCDWANSSDPATAGDPSFTLSPGETVDCVATGTAGEGLHENTATVDAIAAGIQSVDATGEPIYDAVGNPVYAVNGNGTYPAPTDESGEFFSLDDADASGYLGSPPAIDIVKTVTGTPDGEVAEVVEGQSVGWTFVVTNTGAGALENVEVTDPTLAAMGVTITCDWATSSDPTTGDEVLAQGEMVTCTAASDAGGVDLVNTATVTGYPVDGGPPVDDDDPAEYVVGVPDIQVVKTTCTDPANVPGSCSDGPLIPQGDALVWFYEIENTGEVTLVDVTLGDNVEAGVSAANCDWNASSDPATGANILSVGETVPCTQAGTAGFGDYDNVADVEGTPGATDGTPALTPGGTPVPPVTDDDPSDYFGIPAPAIDIEKDTNGNQADVIGDQDILAIGQDVTWTFVVTNSGMVDLANVVVNDDVVIDNGTAEGVISCDWVGTSTDPATPAGNLSVDESVTCSSTSVAEAGQYGNLSDVVGTPVEDATSDTPVVLTDVNGDPLADVVDEDPSHYFAAAGPAIDIEKDTNGNQADVIGDQDILAVGQDVTWTFVVTNTGDVDLANVVVNDDVVIDNGTAEGVISCDWIGTSTDPATPAGNLSVDESVTCSSTSTAEAGQYGNLSDVVGAPVEDATSDTPVVLTDVNGDPLANVVDDDPSHYFAAAAPEIDIEKDTNGNQADTIGAQDVIVAGDPVVWTFVVTNTGDVDLANVVVNDDVVIDNGTAEGAISCDWIGTSTDSATPAGNLSVDESVTCSSTSTAEAGQYGNLSDVVGTPVEDATSDTPVVLTDGDGNPLADVVDEDPSHYFAAAGPAIDIEKDTNGNQADLLADQDTLAVGQDVTWTFVVTNTGDVDLANVVVNDDVVIDNGTVEGAVSCDWVGTSTDSSTPAGNLSVDESVTCTSTSVAEAGQYGNLSDVVGTPVEDATSDTPVVLTDVNGNPLANVVDEDPSHYFAAAAPEIDIEKNTNGNQADTIGAQDTLSVNQAVTWTFVVTNTGDVDLANVVVNDDVVIDNGTVEGAVSCDWIGTSTDPASPTMTLTVDESVTCTSTSTAQAGQYGNLSDVVGTPVDDATSATPVVLTDVDGDPLPNVVDEDPSHYFAVAAPEIDIEKDTNGRQADTTAGQEAIAVGEAVTWTFVVTNTGDVDLANVTVADDAVIDNGTAEGTISCDWVGTSTDPATPDGNLSVDESVTCTSSSIAVAGQYGNLADVVGTPVDDATSDTPVVLTDVDGDPLANVVDEDPSHYFGGTAPSIDIEKDTNGNQADVVADQDVIMPGDLVTWTFVVTNTGDADLANVVVNDDVVIDNGTVEGVISCDWVGTSTDPATPAGNLSVDESVTCSSTSTAEAGQYGNLADVVGTPVEDATSDTPVVLTDPAGDPLPNVIDEDPSHYFGPEPEIDIEKDTNGNQADVVADQDVIMPGDPVTWTFVVTNTGTVDLANVTVNDDVVIDNGTAEGTISCDWIGTSTDPATPEGNLSVDESVTCSSTSTAEAGQYGNLSDVVGTPVEDATSATPVVLVDSEGTPVPQPTDEDPSHYFGPVPAIDIEKDTNGNQADVIADQDTLTVGQDVTWTFVVTNTGTVDLANVTVNDDVVIDNGTAEGVISCDWIGTSTDPATPDGNLSVDESVTCSSTSTAEAGQYGNLSDVVGTPVEDATSATPVVLVDSEGTPVPQPTDEDPSHYFAEAGPAILIEKDTNGNQADTIGAQDTYAVGDAVTWTFVVTNIGDVDLANVTVNDDVVIDNGTVEGVITCDWRLSTDSATPPGNLSVDESVTCASSSTAEAGQYGNLADVVGTPVDDATSDTPVVLTDPAGDPLPNVIDDDPSHYFGAEPAIDIEKDTNGNQADLLADQDTLAVGQDVTWTFVVTNTGNVDLANVTVNDDVAINNGTAESPITCGWELSTDETTPVGNLSVGESVTCVSTSTAEAGQYGNLSDVVGTPVDDAASGTPVALTNGDGDPLPNVVDEDPSHYFGAGPGIDIEKDTNGNQADTMATQDSLTPGDDVTWTFVVENVGNVDLAAVSVADAVTIDNGTTTGDVVCDWSTSSDEATPAGNLSVDETVTCTATGTTAAGQYGNLAEVVGTPVEDAVTADPIDPVTLTNDAGEPLDRPTDEDPSHYFGAEPSIDIEKDTNGNQADVVADQQVIQVGSELIWTFEVTNTGNVDLADVTVADAVTIDNGTVTGAVNCDWANSSDTATPAGNLSIDETVTCSAAGVATSGQYGNLAEVVGTPVDDASSDDPVALTDDDGEPLAPVNDEDPSHYFGESGPSIDIEKDTNGNQADTAATQNTIPAGDDVTWTFVVENNGDADLADVDVTDAVTIDNGTVTGAVECDWDGSSDAGTPAGNLSVGETVTCTAAGVAVSGQYANVGTVVGTPVEDATSDDPVVLTDVEGNPLDQVTDDDPSHYYGGDASIDIEKDTNGNQADVIADQDMLTIGDPVTWTFDVVNDGNVDLAGVEVTDSVTIDNGTAPADVVCDWDASSDAATPAGNLSIGETVTCAASSTVAAGQYGNNADVVGTPVEDAVTADPDNPTPLVDGAGNPVPSVTDEDPSHFFGPVLDVALRIQTADGENDVTVNVGDEVDFMVTVFNQGNVPAGNLDITAYVPAGLELVGNAWVVGADGARTALEDVVLEPGESMSIELTLEVANDQVESFEIEAEVSSADGVNSSGELLAVLGSAGVSHLVDIDSTPDAVNDEDPVDDEIGDDGTVDEDDHDRVGITIASTPVTPLQPLPPVTQPDYPGPFTPPATPVAEVPELPATPLAVTGVESRLLFALGMALIAMGGVVVIATRRRDEEWA